MCNDYDPTGSPDCRHNSCVHLCLCGMRSRHYGCYGEQCNLYDTCAAAHCRYIGNCDRDFPDGNLPADAFCIKS